MGIRLRSVVIGALVAATSSAGFAASATALSTAGDQQLAKAGVLTRADFPDGWTQKVRRGSSDAAVDKAAAKIPSCKQFIAFGKANGKNPRVKSPEFDLGQASVDNAVNIFPSANKATAAMATFGNADLPGCLGKLFRSVFAAQFAKDPKTAKQIAGVTVNIARDAGVTIGDQAIAYEGPVKVSLKDGTSVTIGLGYIAVRVGRAVSGYTYTADTDISAALQPAIDASITRLQTALKSA